MEKRLWTYEDVLGYFGIESRTTIQNWIKKRGFPVLRLTARMTRFDPEAVIAWAEKEGRA